MIVKIFVLVAFFGVKDVLGGEGVGPLDIELMSTNPCNEGSDAIELTLVSLDNDEKGIDMKFDIPFDLDDTVSYLAKVDRIEGGERQEGAFENGDDYACNDFAKYLGGVWRKASEALGLSEDCPVRAGLYETKGFPFDYRDLDIESFMYGRFILTLELYKDGEMKVCQELEFINKSP